MKRAEFNELCEIVKDLQEGEPLKSKDCQRLAKLIKNNILPNYGNDSGHNRIVKAYGECAVITTWEESPIANIVAVFYELPEGIHVTCLAKSTAWEDMREAVTEELKHWSEVRETNNRMLNEPGKHTSN